MVSKNEGQIKYTWFMAAVTRWLEVLLIEIKQTNKKTHMERK